MGVFNPTLESQVAFEAPIQAPKEYNALTDIAKLATGFVRAVPAPSGSAANNAALASFGLELERARDLREQNVRYEKGLEDAAFKAIRSVIFKN